MQRYTHIDTLHTVVIDLVICHIDVRRHQAIILTCCIVKINNTHKVNCTVSTVINNAVLSSSYTYLDDIDFKMNLYNSKHNPHRLTLGPVVSHSIRFTGGG